MEITTNANYKAANIMRFRGKVTNQELKAAIERLSDHIELNGAKKTGELITATHVLYLESGVSDIEVFVPVDRVIASSDEFEYKSSLNFLNCVTAKYKGCPHFMPIFHVKLYHKIKELGLTEMQPFYCVFKEGAHEIITHDFLEGKEVEAVFYVKAYKVVDIWSGLD